MGGEESAVVAARVSPADVNVQRTHRLRISAVSARTRAVSAAGRRTLFESPVPVGMSRVMKVRVVSDIRPVESNWAPVVVIFIVFLAARCDAFAINSRGRFTESTATVKPAVEVVRRWSMNMRLTPMRKRELS